MSAISKRCCAAPWTLGTEFYLWLAIVEGPIPWGQDEISERTWRGSKSLPKRLAERTDQCAWFLFEAASAWFYQATWDLGVLGLRPGRRTVAVLAATDMD